MVDSAFFNFQYSLTIRFLPSFEFRHFSLNTTNFTLPKRSLGRVSPR